MPRWKRKKQDAIHYSIWAAVHTREAASPVNPAGESRYANLQFILLKQQIGSPNDNRFFIRHMRIWYTRNALHTNGKQSYWWRFICLIDKHIYFIGNIGNCGKYIISYCCIHLKLQSNFLSFDILKNWCQKNMKYKSAMCKHLYSRIIRFICILRNWKKIMLLFAIIIIFINFYSYNK